MTGPIDGPRLKLKRAKNHLDTLKRTTRRFLNEDPYYTVTDQDPETRKFVVKFRVRRDPPDSIGLLIGDCVHNLRSSLDQLTWRLALKTTNTPDDFTSFPIRIRAVGKDSFTSARNGALKSVARADQDAIERLQPYHRGDGVDRHPLYFLHKLWNYDKHRSIPVLGTLVTGGSSTMHPIGRFVVLRASVNLFFSGPFHDGDTVSWYGVGPYKPPDVKYEDEATFDIAFDKEGPGRGYPVVTLLTEIYEHVRDEVFPALEPLFHVITYLSGPST